MWPRAWRVRCRTGTRRASAAAAERALARARRCARGSAPHRRAQSVRELGDLLRAAPRLPARSRLWGRRASASRSSARARARAATARGGRARAAPARLRGSRAGWPGRSRSSPMARARPEVNRLPARRMRLPQERLRYPWISQPSAARPASITASDSVGWPWTMRATSEKPPSSRRTLTSSWISSVARAPTMCPPSSSP